MNSSAAATPPIRGFTFAYPATRNDLDRVALAVANSFVSRSRSRVRRRAQPSGRGSPHSRRPRRPRRPATALIVAPGRALTVLKAGRLPEPQRRRQAGEIRANRRGDRARAPFGRFRRRGRAAAARRADAPISSCSAPMARAYPPSPPRFAGGGSRVVAALEQERGGRSRLRPFGRARGRRRAVRGGAEARRRRGARRPARDDRRRGDRRLSRRRRADPDRGACGPAQRRRDSRAGESGDRAGYVPPALSPETVFAPPASDGGSGLQR